MEDDFAVRFVYTYPGINSRAELVLSRRGLCARVAQRVARGQFLINQSSVYYKIVALDSELQSYLQHLLKTIDIKMYLVLHALCYSNCFTSL
jgi:hypothetical protein